IFSNEKCQLGEGPLWHPLRSELLWFDITNNTLHAQNADQHRLYKFDHNISAAAWINATSVLISGESDLKILSLDTGEKQSLIDVDADNHITRSNDGRADRQHGFWISTMGKNAEQDAGAIYRFYKGELRCLHKNITIPNAICFSPNGDTAYFADSMEKTVFKQRLDIQTGWPINDAETFIDFTPMDKTPDGAVTDALGNIWIAFWGEAMVEGYSPDGKSLGQIHCPTPHTTCPAFGGDDFSTLYVTTAMQGLDDETLAKDENAGKTFSCATNINALAEPHVLLD
ncbi:MAG: SMP-30/gluconolactonase/LRE family protein, partial [Lentilitoribacter sp.]